MMMTAVPKLGAGVMMAMTLMLAASPSVASSTVTTPRKVSASSPCPSEPVTIMPTHAPASGLVAVDLDTHQRFHPLRVLSLNNPLAAAVAGGFLYVSYTPPGPKADFQVARINPKTGAVVRSVRFPGDYYNQPPVVGYGSVWVVSGLCKFQVVRMNQATLAVTMRTPIPQDINNGYLLPSDGALWLASNVSASIARLDSRTGHITTVFLPEMVPDSQVAGFASDPRSGLLYISLINQNSAHSQATERFDPATGSFLVVPPPPGWEYSLFGVAGGILWVNEGPGNAEHFAAFSARTLTPLSCTQSETCTLGGMSGSVFARVEDGILAFEEAHSPDSGTGYWRLDCVAGPRVSTTAQLQLPSDAASLGAPTSPQPLLALGDGYLVTFARVGIYGGSRVAIFPLDPRCAP